MYKRYRQCFELHQTLRRKDPIVNSFDFPPKKSVGNKAERFVEDRRKALQSRHFLDTDKSKMLGCDYWF